MTEQMGVKKVILLSFLLFAGTIILAHAVVPHHYHNGIPLFTENHDVHHSHNQEGVENCSFSKIYVRLSNDRQLFQMLDFNLQPCFLTLFSDCFICKIEKTKPNLNPYLLLYHTEYISQSLGLRAPPFSITN